MARCISDAKLQHSESLLSAYVRVLTFSLDILTIGVLWDREVDISLPRNCNYLDFHVDAQAQKIKNLRIKNKE